MQDGSCGRSPGTRVWPSQASFAPRCARWIGHASRNIPGGFDREVCLAFARSLAIPAVAPKKASPEHGRNYNPLRHRPEGVRFIIRGVVYTFWVYLPLVAAALIWNLGA